MNPNPRSVSVTAVRGCRRRTPKQAYQIHVSRATVSSGPSVCSIKTFLSCMSDKDLHALTRTDGALVSHAEAYKNRRSLRQFGRQRQILRSFDIVRRETVRP